MYRVVWPGNEHHGYSGIIMVLNGLIIAWTLDKGLCSSLVMHKNAINTKENYYIMHIYFMLRLKNNSMSQSCHTHLFCDVSLIQ